MNLISEVKELGRFNSVEISKLLKENGSFALLHIRENGSTLKIDVDKLVRLLPLHLTAVLLSSQKDEALLRYLLSGLRLLYSFCEIASRHPKLEQILLDDLKVSEQLLDLVFYVLIVCSSSKQGVHFSGSVPLVYSALVACSLYLLTVCISSQWNELAFVLQVHPKVDVFIDAAFGAVRRNVNLLQNNLSAEGYQGLACEKTVFFCSQQCEASLQFLHQICQNNSFRERLLKNKELCEKGGLLRFVYAALKLFLSPILRESLAVVAAVSRLKARALSILLILCETENVSYLDEVASIPESLNLAKSVVLEVVTLLKTMLSVDFIQPENHSGKAYPMGLLHLNALRLADIFSDDSNFRCHFTVHFTEVLAAILSTPYRQFLSSWCSSDLPLKEEDMLLDYEPFTVAEWILSLTSSSDTVNAGTYESNFSLTGGTQITYAHQRTSLLVKVIANLHCFVPNICKEQERNFFLHRFVEHLNLNLQQSHAGYAPRSQPVAGISPSSVPQKATTVCKNLRSLLSHAESLIPTFLNEEDVQLLRVFFTQLQSLVEPVDYEMNGEMETQNARGYSSSLYEGTELNQMFRNSSLMEGVSENTAFPGLVDYCIPDEFVGEADVVFQDDTVCEDISSRASLERLAEFDNDVQTAETSGSDSSSTRRKDPGGQACNGEITKLSEHFCIREMQGSQEAERLGSSSFLKKQTRKRRRVMNEEQVSMIDKALLDEPDLARSAASLQSWADRLSSHGLEVASLQLKNWLQNRKAKFARAARDGHLSSKKNPIGDKEDDATTRYLSESSEKVVKDCSAPATDQNEVLKPNTSRSLEIAFSENSTKLKAEMASQASIPKFARFEAGQAVVLMDPEGKEVALGTVIQVEGDWQGVCLELSKTCVVDITELMSERIAKLPHPSIDAGATFGQAEVKVEKMRVLWDADRMRIR